MHRWQKEFLSHKRQKSIVPVYTLLVNGSNDPGMSNASQADTVTVVSEWGKPQTRLTQVLGL